MAIQSHRSHPVHGPFGPAFVVNSSISSAQASSFTKLPNVSVNPHGKPTHFFISGGRTGSAPTPQAVSTPRMRRPAPRPPLRHPLLSTYAEDPFADQPIIEIVSPPPRSTPSSPSIASRTRIPPPALPESVTSSLSPSASQPVAPIEAVVVPPGIQPVMLLPEFGYHEARGRLVACILLSRNCGRPMRRRRSPCMAGQTYVPSALSRTVAVDLPA
ncbi:uncharacterized protein B0H18DRAFT_991644 [Fomitopsis serialis]|uniref:uncharacterized protein n=1 Tax=Fomitopsis serialis TaxID=139415 RepID=UPI0020078C5A|nr:uncharacterized protein B0H18DRAFT_991644 [Neoantrodia serialis]KAH9930867.1 hypothetical protein B0H18DRAFT_991644 [Neoantrodia serialis]